MAKKVKKKVKNKMVVQKVSTKDLYREGVRNDMFVMIPILEDRKKMNNYQPNQLLNISVAGSISPRSVRMHRLFFAMVHKLVENANGFITEGQALEWIKIKIAYIEEHVIFEGDRHHFKTGSISFENMEQFEFAGFFDKAITLIAETLKVTEEDLLNSREDL